MIVPTTRALALALLMLATAAPATFAATDHCAAAKADLLGVWEDPSHELTPQVAGAIKTYLDSCPADEPTTQTTSTCVGPGCTSVMLRIPLAKECGFGSIATAKHPAAPITAWYQVGGVNQPEPDEGEALATYTPATDETTYHNIGEKWGLDASSTGAATIYLHGLPIPARGTATAGCSAVGEPELCWAKGVAQVTIEGVGGIVVTSSFTNC